MKNLFYFLLLCLSVILTNACTEKNVIAPSNETITSREAIVEKNTQKTEVSNFIAKYSFKALLDEKLSREFELTFSYDENGKLVSINRTDKSYNFITGKVSSEGYTNWAMKYNDKGSLSQATSFNNKSLTFNASSVLDYIYDNGNLSSVNLAVIKDEKQILSLERYKLNYSQNKQLISYKSGNDKGHDFNYKDNFHESSLLKGTSSFDFEYGTNFSPTADYEDGVKFVIFQALEADPARGFGLVSRNLPTKLINKTGGIIEFESIVNENKFPTKIIEKMVSGNSFAKSIINIEYKRIEK